MDVSFFLCVFVVFYTQISVLLSQDFVLCPEAGTTEFELRYNTEILPNNIIQWQLKANTIGAQDETIASYNTDTKSFNIPDDMKDRFGGRLKPGTKDGNLIIVNATFQDSGRFSMSPREGVIERLSVDFNDPCISYTMVNSSCARLYCQTRNVFRHWKEGSNILSDQQRYTLCKPPSDVPVVVNVTCVVIFSGSTLLDNTTAIPFNFATPTQHPPATDGLSGGAIAGIVIAAAVVLIGGIVAVICLMQRKGYIPASTS